MTGAAPRPQAKNSDWPIRPVKTVELCRDRRSKLEPAGDVLPAEEAVAGKKARACCGSILPCPGISVKGDVGRPPSALSAECAPIDGRIENVCSAGGGPLEPGVSLAAGPHAFSDHEPDIFNSA